MLTSANVSAGVGVSSHAPAQQETPGFPRHIIRHAGARGLGVAQVNFLAKSVVSFSSHGTMRRNGASFALFAVREIGHRAILLRRSAVLRNAMVMCGPLITSAIAGITLLGQHVSLHHPWASLKGHTEMGYSLEAIDTTMRYVIQQGSERGETVGLPVGERSPLFVLCSPCRI